MEQTVLLQPVTPMGNRKRARLEDPTPSFLEPMRRLCLAATDANALPPLRSAPWTQPQSQPQSRAQSESDSESASVSVTSTPLPSLAQMLQPPSFDNSRIVTPIADLPRRVASDNASLRRLRIEEPQEPHLEQDPETILSGRISGMVLSPEPSINTLAAATPDQYELALGQEPEDKTPWPTAIEYSHLLSNMSAYSTIPVYDLGEDPRGVPLHPAFIYTQPRSCMYFLRCHQLLGRGSFGFPRQRTVTTQVGPHMCSKAFEWRKMSFVTGVPKKKPLVRYITATCYSRAASKLASASAEKKEKKKMLRMHAVMLANEDGTGECGDFVLVHIRAGGCKRVGARMTQHPSSPMRPSYPTAEYPAAICASSPPQNKTRQCEMAASFLMRKPMEPLWLSPPSRESETPSVKRNEDCLAL